MQNNMEYDQKSGVSKLVDGTEGAFNMPYQMSIKEYQKLAKEGLSDNIKLELGDSENLNFQNPPPIR